MLQTGVATNKEAIEAAESVIATHADNIAANAAAIEAANATIAANQATHEADVQALEAKIEASRPKSSDEITVSENGTLSIKQMSTDKLVNGSFDLILDGGGASN